jgi:lipoprotein-anchoring transpeptidase ErfK/SrfK
VTAYTRRIGLVGLVALGLAVTSVPAAAAVPAPASGSAYVGRVVSATTTAPAPTTTTPPVADRPVPKHSGTGRRIVYSERTPQHVWLVAASGRVVRAFAVSGRKDWPRAGTYRVFSKSPRSYSTTYGVSFRWMVRFAHGHSASIGFHTIPRYRSGRLMHPLTKLGKPVGRGGCPHSADPDARFLYRWAGIGTKVVVVR